MLTRLLGRLALYAGVPLIGAVFILIQAERYLAAAALGVLLVALYLYLRSAAAKAQGPPNSPR